MKRARNSGAFKEFHPRASNRTARGPTTHTWVGLSQVPGCTSPRTIGTAELDAPIAWTPDGRGIAYATDGNVWVQPLSGSAPRRLTRFVENRPIGSFAWSRDGKCLAVARSTTSHDIVLFKGLK